MNVRVSDPLKGWKETINLVLSYLCDVSALIQLKFLHNRLQKGAAAQLPADYRQVLDFADEMCQHVRYRSLPDDTIVGEQMQTLQLLLSLLRVAINWSQKNVDATMMSVEVL